MKTYSKTHSNKTALNNHVSRIKKRGGVCSLSGTTVTYHFPSDKPEKKTRKKQSKLKYDTHEKRLKTVRKKGNIITFKKPFRWMGTEYIQILSYGIQKQNGHVKIVGAGRDSDWYDNIDELIKAVDWDLMEAWHTED